MRTIIIDGMESENSIGTAVKKVFKGRDFTYFRLKDMNILPCRSCGSCGLKTPGKCVFVDDMPKLLRAIAPSSFIVMITPIRFGGYSSQLKKAIDKLTLIGAPLYMVKEGHLLHPMRYGEKSLVVMGLTEENLQGQEEAFRTLVANNGLNMGCPYNKALIFKPTDSVEVIENEIYNLFSEVNVG